MKIGKEVGREPKRKGGREREEKDINIFLLYMWKAKEIFYTVFRRCLDQIKYVF